MSVYPILVFAGVLVLGGIDLCFDFIRGSK